MNLTRSTIFVAVAMLPSLIAAIAIGAAVRPLALPTPGAAAASSTPSESTSVLTPQSVEPRTQRHTHQNGSIGISFPDRHSLAGSHRLAPSEREPVPEPDRHSVAAPFPVTRAERLALTFGHFDSVANRVADAHADGLEADPVCVAADLSLIA